MPGPALPGAAEQPVQDDQAPHLAHPVLGQEPGQPHDGPGLQPALGQPVDPRQVLGRRVPGLVERVVDHEPPASRPRPEVVLGEPAGVPDVAEHHVHRAPRAAPDDRVRVDAEHVRVPLGDPERVAHQVLEQLAAPALVVLALGVLHHRLVVDVGQLHPDHRVARVAADVDLRHLPVPLPDLGQHDARLAARQRRPDRAVVERGQPGRGQLLQRRDLGRDRGQQQRLGQPVIGTEPRRQPFRIPGGVLLGEVAGRQQDRPQLVPVQRGGRPEQRRRLRVQGIPALHDVVEGVTDRDHVVHGQRVPPADQHLLHDLQRGPLPLHHAGQRPQRRHQGRGERVGQPERRLVRAAVPVVGVHPVQQHVPDVRAPVQPGERVREHLIGLRVVRPAAAAAAGSPRTAGCRPPAPACRTAPPDDGTPGPAPPAPRRSRPRRRTSGAGPSAGPRTRPAGSPGPPPRSRPAWSASATPAGRTPGPAPRTPATAPARPGTAPPRRSPGSSRARPWPPARCPGPRTRPAGCTR